MYDPVLGACVCDDGYYKNNYGFCEQTVLPPVSCEPGKYFDDEYGCVACPAGCKTCENDKKCKSCSVAGFIPYGG